jgi:osmotically-inducible protein OsmY
VEQYSIQVNWRKRTWRHHIRYKTSEIVTTIMPATGEQSMIGGRGGYYGGRDRAERDFFERAGDDMHSWFGEEEAERRRRMDEMRSGLYLGRGPRGYKRSDERIREDVNHRLTEEYYLNASDIEVGVNNCVVTLTGRMDTRHDKRRAEDLAESVSGVTDVTNHLRVGQSAPVTTTGTETTGTSRTRTART